MNDKEKLYKKPTLITVDLSDDVILTSQEFTEKDANEQEIPWGFGD